MKNILKEYCLKMKDYKNRNIISAILLIALIFLILGTIAFERYESGKTLTLGVITDIHAGSLDTRDDSIEPNNILHPSNYKKNLERVLPEMKKDDLILTLGDNLNAPSEKYTAELKKATAGYPMVWTKGNHDKPDFFKQLSGQRYYYVDKKNWRIIVLDNSASDPEVEIPDGAYDQKGYLDPEQMDWLEGALKTEKKIIIAMHVPVFDRFQLDSAAIYPQQENLVKLFEKSGNVKFVLAGHFHVYDFNREINGIRYRILPSLELDGQEGYFTTLKLDSN
jgi:3',5'-cyclic AMP phosphodiesterase CpdA